MPFHAFDPNDSLFSHNVYVGRGKIIAVSAMVKGRPEWSGMMSPYQAFTRERAKEELFEEVRARDYGDRPTRMGSIFLFPTLENAELANAAWWGNKRVILEATVVHSISEGTFDSQHLNAPADQWEPAAHRYWSGESTTDPHLEMVVCGTIQLIGWQAHARLMSP